ncbi:hypothetical protein SALBM311S_12191 [Streptomyces alboniger]
MTSAFSVLEVVDQIHRNRARFLSKPATGPDQNPHDAPTKIERLAA